MAEFVLIKLDDANVLCVLVGRCSSDGGRAPNDVSNKAVLRLALIVLPCREMGLERVDPGLYARQQALMVSWR